MLRTILDALMDFANNSYIAQNPEAQDWFEYAPYWERTHPVVEQMRLALGLTHEQIDNLFL